MRSWSKPSNHASFIILQAKDESGWWLGKLDKTGVVGWFAPDLVVPLDEKLENEKVSVVTHGKKKSVDEKIIKKKTPISRKKSKKKIKAKKCDDDKKDEQVEIVSMDESEEPEHIISYDDLKKKQFGNV